MDVQTGLVCVVLVIISGALLLFISMFGMREKTYEEAIAEQRKMPDDALLLGRPNKDKNKEKKQKRQGKKAKEKPNDNKPKNKAAVKSQLSRETVSEPAPKETEHSHVNFVTPVAEVLKGVNTKHPDEKKKKKKEKIKPILVNKEEPVIVKDKPSHKVVAVNHFTEIIPKDDLQLKLATTKPNYNLNNSQPVHVNSNENINGNEKTKGKSVSKAVSKENNKIENVKNQKNAVKVVNQSNKVQKNERNQQQQQQQQKNPSPQHVKVEVNGNLSSSSVEQSPVQKQKVNNQQSNNKEQKNKKHKKNELSALQQMTERDGINIQLLVPLIRKAELSRTEVQILTDILLTKHLDEVSDHFEWIEGRQDPVVKLKKQLAEKEKALAEEQEASQAFQNKLKELRSEYNAERARLTQACRQYDETILAKQGEIQNLHATNRHMMDNHVAEKQALTQKIQQLQAQVNDENMVIRKLQEDHNQTQNHLQQELVSQRQQMEMHIARLSEQLQETQKNLEAQIHAKMQEAEQLRASFNAELQKNRRCEEELRELREQHVQNQNKIKNLESQLKEASNHTQELARQLEELQRANKELEKRLNNSLKAEEELTFEKDELQKEIHRFSSKIAGVQREFGKLMKDKEEVVAKRKAEWEKDLLRVKEENKCLISQLSSLTKIQAQQLRKENENAGTQFTAFPERPAADGRENGDATYDEDKKKNINVEFINHENETKQKEVIIEKLENELKQKEVLVEKLNSELNGCQSEISRLSSEVAKYKTEVPKLRDELEAQRNKNNDLRRRNSKAMEALSAAEKSLENNLRETEKLAQDRLNQEQQATKNLLERIFPSIKIDEKVYENWLYKFENNAKNYLEDITSAKEKSSPTPELDSSYVEELESKNAQLQGLVAHYKTIIEDTEGMLNKLQSHIETEEVRWSQQLEVLQAQIQSQKENQAELISKIKDLEEKLAEKEALGVLTEAESEKCKKLTEYNEALTAKVAAAEEEVEALKKELEKLRDAVKFEQNDYVEENMKRLDLKDELKLFNDFSHENNIRDTPINSTAEFMASEGKPKSRKSNWQSLSGWFRKKVNRKNNSIKSRQRSQKKIASALMTEEGKK